MNGNRNFHLNGSVSYRVTNMYNMVFGAVREHSKSYFVHSTTNNNGPGTGVVLEVIDSNLECGMIAPN